MTRAGVYSDEPSRVGRLISDFLAGQSGSVVSPAETTPVTLLAGADARDDCAVYQIDGPVTVVTGTDYVRGARFVLYELGLLSGFDIGYYLVAANVSDVAAMGATPIGVLTVVRYPPELDDAGFHELMAGIHQACADFGTVNVGGDIGNAERIILSGAALGVCPPGRALTRSGARPGDVLCVTGPCGVLGAAVAYFPRKAANGWLLPAAVEDRLLGGWRRPVARVAEGRVLSGGPYATACQDSSDGLKATIEQLAAASDVGFDVDVSRIPVDDAVTAVAGLIGVDALALTMSASADFQLVFTAAPEALPGCRRDFHHLGLDFTVIGTATEAGRVRAVAPDGTSGPLPGVAWRHQSSDISRLVPDNA